MVGQSNRPESRREIPEPLRNLGRSWDRGDAPIHYDRGILRIERASRGVKGYPPRALPPRGRPLVQKASASSRRPDAISSFAH